MEMETLTLAVNIGSSSKKYALYSADARLRSAHFEQVGDGFEVSRDGGSASLIEREAYESSLRDFLAGDASRVGAVGIRVVSPGKFFQQHRLIDDEFISALRARESEDPVHVSPVLAEVDRVKLLVPNAALIAVSDSAFHASIPEVSRFYGIPKAVTEKHELYRFGYHGLAVSASLKSLAALNGSLPSRVIVCQLGSGASVTAVKDGHSVDTSMGFSPLEGLVMSSRAGDIDAGAVLTLMQRENLTPQAARDMLYRESGLLGISGISLDMRVLLEKRIAGNVDASRAIALFVRKVQHYVGAYFALLGGLDALVFSGTIGVRSAPIRNDVALSLAAFGVALDEAKNQAGAMDSFIQSTESRVPVAITRADEEAEIAAVTNGYSGA